MPEWDFNRSSGREVVDTTSEKAWRCNIYMRVMRLTFLGMGKSMTHVVRFKFKSIKEIKTLLGAACQHNGPSRSRRSGPASQLHLKMSRATWVTPLIRPNSNQWTPVVSGKYEMLKWTNGGGDIAKGMKGFPSANITKSQRLRHACPIPNAKTSGIGIVLLWWKRDLTKHYKATIYQ